MSSIVTPIVTTIMYETMFQPLIPKQTEEAYPPSTAPQKIIKEKDKFQICGLENTEEMLLFAKSWPEVTDTRNTIAHSATGDEVVDCLPYMSEDVRRIITRGFQKIFGCAVDEWSNATTEPKKEKDLQYKCKRETVLYSYPLILLNFL